MEEEMEQEEKTWFDVPVTFELLEKYKDDKDSLTDIEKEACENWKQKEERECKRWEEANDEVDRDCRILCSGMQTGGFIPAAGWVDPVAKLCYALEDLNIRYRKYGVKVTVSQTKEKFGTLRFYYDVCCEPAYGWLAPLHIAAKKLYDVLWKVEYDIENVTDKPAWTTLEWEECKEEAYEKKLTAFGDPVKDSAYAVSEKDGRWFDAYGVDVTDRAALFRKDESGKCWRSYLLYHQGKYHLEARKHKFLYWFMRRVGDFRTWLSDYEKEVEPEINAMRTSFSNQVEDLVNDAENKTYRVCQDCGSPIPLSEDGTNGYERCVTHGWVGYWCRKCAQAKPDLFEVERTGKWYSGTKEVDNPYEKKSAKPKDDRTGK